MLKSFHQRTLNWRDFETAMANIEEIIRTIEELQSRIERLEKSFSEVYFGHPVKQILTQRGYRVLSCNDFSEVILPRHLSKKVLSRYKDLLSRYSFRLFLRDLINRVEGDDWRKICRYCSQNTSRAYIGFLKSAGLVEVQGNHFSYTGPKVRSFGATLEWYVHELLKDEFLAPTLFGVKLKNTPHGGDYDVVSFFHGFLVYIEVKSSPPRGVELTNVEAFLHRLEDISPDVALFVVDTELRMKDKIVKLFEESTGKKVKRLVRELFFLDDGVYLVNTQKGMASNMRYCFKHFFKVMRRLV